MKITNVVAGVIKMNGMFFIAQRNKDKHLGLKWEFPGGKVEANESRQNALKREINEELNIEIKIINKISNSYYVDEKINILIHYYYCEIIKGTILLNEHENFAWVYKEEFKNFDLVEGDENIVKML